jgi:iron complex transport system substrate-binding protein
VRVVSLLPSATEILAQLGHLSELVGRSEECDYPPEVRGLPAVMRATILDSELPSAEIDARVRATRGRQVSLYTLDLPLLGALRPDLVLTQDLCGVCSVTESEVLDACRETGLDPEILSLSPQSLEEVLGSLQTVADAIDDPAAGGRAVAALERRLDGDITLLESPPRVAVVEWLDPPILAGLWVPEMIRRAGGTPWGNAENGSTAVRSSWEALAADPPDHLLLSPCSFSVPRTARELGSPKFARALAPLANSPGVWIADEAYFSRPGPRLFDGLDLLRTVVTGGTPTGPMPVEQYAGPSEEVLA